MMDEILETCPICFLDYNLTDTIPRIFPCQHTVCSPCTDQIIRNSTAGKVRCPECRAFHFVPGRGSFQENRYIVAFLQNSPKKSELCKEHNEGLKLYCNLCQKPICWRCVATTHNGHKVDVFEEKLKEERQSIEQEADAILKAIGDRLEVLKKTKQMVRERENTVCNRIRKDRDEIKHTIDTYFNKTINDVQEERKRLNKEITDEEQHFTEIQQRIVMQKERAKDSIDFLKYKNYFATVEVQPNADVIFWSDTTYTPLIKNDRDLTASALCGELRYTQRSVTIDPIRNFNRSTLEPTNNRLQQVANNWRKQEDDGKMQDLTRCPGTERLSRKRPSSNDSDPTKRPKYPDMFDNYSRCVHCGKWFPADVVQCNRCNRRLHSSNSRGGNR